MNTELEPAKMAFLGGTIMHHWAP